jgi:hypothetical protein
MTDFFVANFTGTGTLTAYTPDTGTAFTAPSTGNIADGTFDHGYSTTAMLAYVTRATAGSMVQIKANPWGDDFLLQNATAPTGADYYVETAILLSAAASINFYFGHYHRAIRGTAGEAGMFDGLVMRFAVDETDSTHRQVLYAFADAMLDRSVATSVTFTDEVDHVTFPYALGSAASVTIRSEVQGSSFRAFAGAVLIYSATIVDSGNYLTAAGKFGWSIQFDNAGTYSGTAIDSMKAGDTFLVIPSSFWRGFVQAVEVFP